jgi:endonuclease G, mitochondrial
MKMNLKLIRDILICFFFIIQTLGMAQDFDYLPSTTTGEIIKHTYYSLSYSSANKQAEWVAYELTKQNLEMGFIKRTDDFRPDPLVTDSPATLADYKNSGYDRGHLCPAGDMKLNSVSMTETFYLSNMSPMKPEFNRGIWEQLEEQVRTWAKENDKIFVVTGGILKYSLGTIGESKIPVPKYFYKVILDYEQPGIKAIALILPNEKGTLQLPKYAVTIDSVEALTGIDFFPALPDSLENALESKIDISKWTFMTTADSTIDSPPNQCKGVTAEGLRCKITTTNENGYCDKHQSQVGKVDMSKEQKNRLTVAVQCSATTQTGERCKRKTYSPNGKCWQHGGD